MELKDFVSETLKQIIIDVKSAQEIAKEQGGQINPSGMYATAASENTVLRGPNREVVQEIEFDVAVTTTQEDQAKGGIGIFVGGIGIGVQGQSGDRNSAINRIKFKVPIILPFQKQ